MAAANASPLEISSSTTRAAISCTRMASISWPAATYSPKSDRMVKRGMKPSVGTTSSTLNRGPATSAPGRILAALWTGGGS